MGLVCSLCEVHTLIFLINMRSRLLFFKFLLPSSQTFQPPHFVRFFHTPHSFRVVNLEMNPPFSFIPSYSFINSGPFAPPSRLLIQELLHLLFVYSLLLGYQRDESTGKRGHKVIYLDKKRQPSGESSIHCSYSFLGIMD